jgi:hypothetical protein
LAGLFFEHPLVRAWARPLVGASLLAMVGNDNAHELDNRGALKSIASKLAPTVSRDCVKNLFCLKFLFKHLPTFVADIAHNFNPFLPGIYSGQIISLG